jgi:protein involved in polysaccharide export with SLBB domain
MKILSFILFLIFPILLKAQPGSQNNTVNPYGSNPYSTNPYGSNPYGDQPPPNTTTEPNKEEGQYTEDAIDKMKDEKKTNATSDKTKENKDKLLESDNFQDVNNSQYNMQDREMQANPQNDPTYTNYSSSSINQSTNFNNSIESKKDSSKRKIFGMSFFSNNVFDLSDRTPSTPPLDYRLGPGDEVIVSLWGNAELQQTYKLAKDGSIFPKLVGKIYLQGLTFDAASSVISGKFRKIVPINTSIEVQMGKSRTIRVTVVGEVKKQGTYTMSAFNTALNAVFRAGGLTEIGNLRKIEIKREGRTVEILDIYEYLQKGKNGSEIYLEDNDYIYVDVYEKLVNAMGKFKRPMYYQLTSDEGLRDLVELAGGPASDARNSLIHIKTVVNEEQKYIDISGHDYFSKGNQDDFVLNDGDLVDLKPINEGLKNTIKVEGAVNYPDVYEVRTNEKLSDVLKRAGGLDPNAYKPSAYIFRGENALESQTITVDLENVESNPLQNVNILQGDIVKILSNKDFEQKYKIDVLGSVRKPGTVPYYKNMRLKDLLLLSGGLRLDAENGRIEISNLVDSVTKYEIKSSGNTIRIVSINSNLEIDQVSENIIIKPLDRVYVRRKIEFLAQQIVTIVGNVNYPGEYVLNDKNERLTSIIKRAGGVNEEAFTDGAKLIRSRTGAVVIELSKALETNGSKHDIILRDSDMIIVPSINEIVSVRGEIQSPVNIKYDQENTHLKYYINSAGGFGERPWKGRINVRYQNGRIKNTKSYVFFRKYPRVTKGCTVFVPRKAKKENQTKFTEIFSYTISAITSIATLIVLAKSLNGK